jgi:hypothetical protein
MRKLGLVLSLVAALGLCLPWAARAENSVGPTNLILCNKIATMAAGPLTITQLIAAVVGQTIILCGWEITNTGATGTFSFQSGTGVNCATNPATIVPPLNITNTAPSVDRQQYATIQLPLGSALCITPSVATIAAVIWYVQL